MSVNKEYNFKPELRVLADKIKSDATKTGNTAAATKAIITDALEVEGLTPEMAQKVENVYGLVGNAAILAGGELANEHFSETPSDENFSLTVPGVGRDSFDVNIRHHGMVTIPANKHTGAEARDEVRALMVGSQRWTHHSNRTAAEYTGVKQHLNHIGKHLLASLAKNNE